MARNAAKAALDLVHTIRDRVSPTKDVETALVNDGLVAFAEFERELRESSGCFRTSDVEHLVMLAIDASLLSEGRGMEILNEPDRLRFRERIDAIREAA